MHTKYLYQKCRHPGGGGVGWVLKAEFYTWTLRPEVQPLNLLRTIFHQKGIPLVYLLLTNDTPFIYLVQNFAFL